MNMVKNNNEHDPQLIMISYWKFKKNICSKVEQFRHP